VSKPIVGFLTSYRYGGAYIYANIAVWGDLLLRCSYVISIFYLVYNKPKLLMVRSFIVAIVSLCTWWAFIDKWQFIGAAWAKIVINSAQIIIMVIIFMASDRVKFPFSMVGAEKKDDSNGIC